MPSGREHGFSQGEESTSYGHVCLVTANSGRSGPICIRLLDKTLMTAPTADWADAVVHNHDARAADLSKCLDCAAVSANG